jgi:hypothetical protein
MKTLTRTSTATLTSSDSSLQSLVNKLRYEQRLPTRTEISYAENLCQAIEKQAWTECVSYRERMLGLATHPRKVFNTPFTRHSSDRDDDPGRSGIYLDRDNEDEDREFVLRTGEKRSACTLPASNPSKWQQRQPNRSAPECSARSDQRHSDQGDLDVSFVIARNNDILNSTNDEGGHSQSLENPSATNYLTSSAPIYNQNVNSGSGQQNIDVRGRMGFQKHDCQEASLQGAAAGQSSQLPLRTQTVDARPQQRNDLGLDHREFGPVYPSAQNSPSHRRSRSPTRPASYSRSGSMVSRPYSPRRYGSRQDDKYEDRYGSRRDDDYSDRYAPRSDDDYEDRYGRARSTSNGDSYGSDYSSDYSY